MAKLEFIGIDVVSGQQKRIPDNVFNVKSYGALGDGTTDDRSAINAAITAAAAAGGGEVRLPAGTYAISGSLGSSTYAAGFNNIAIVGAGRDATIIKNTSNTVAISFGNGDGSLGVYGKNYRVSDLTIDMNSLTAGSNGGMAFNNCQFVTLERTKVINKVSGAHAMLYFGTSTNASSAMLGKHLRIIDCIWGNDSGTSTSNWEAITLSQAEDIKIYGGLAQNTAKTQAMVLNYGSHDLSIFGMEFKNCRGFWSNGFGNVLLQGCNFFNATSFNNAWNVTHDNCSFDNTDSTTGCGITFSGYQQAAGESFWDALPADTNVQLRNNKVINCRFKYCNPVAIASGTFLDSGSVKHISSYDLEIKGCTIERSNAEGIDVTAQDYLLLENNTSYNNGQGLLGYNYTFGATRVQAKNNRSFDNQGVATATSDYFIDNQYYNLITTQDITFSDNKWTLGNAKFLTSTDGYGTSSSFTSTRPSNVTIHGYDNTLGSYTPGSDENVATKLYVDTVGTTKMPVFNVKAYGALGDGKIYYDGAINASSSTLTVASGAFASTDVGKAITVGGAGAAGVVLTTTIATYISATSVTLSVTASTTVSGKLVMAGTLDHVAIQAAIDAANTAGGGEVVMPTGTYFIGSRLNFNNRSNIIFRSAGKNAARLAVREDRYTGGNFGYSYMIHTDAGSTSHDVTIDGIYFWGGHSYITAPIGSIVGGICPNRRWLVQNNTFEDFNYFVIGLGAETVNTKITNNLFKGAGRGDDTIGNGGASYLDISYNTWEAGMNANAIDSTGGTFYNIHHNTIHSNSIYLEAVRHADVHYNTMTDGGLSASSDAGYGPTSITNSYDIHFRNNNITNGGGITYTLAGDTVKSSTIGGQVHIIGNTIDTPSDYGILVQAYGDTTLWGGPITITDNNIINANNNNGATINTGYGIIHPSAINVMQGYNILVANNNCVDTRVTPRQIYGVEIGQTFSPSASNEANHVTVANNQVTGYVTGKVNRASATYTSDYSEITDGVAQNVTGVVAIANGGTGSATKNFIDLTTGQTAAGNKTFTGATTLTAASASNQTPLTINQNDTTNNPVALTISNTGTGLSGDFIGTGSGTKNIVFGLRSNSTATSTETVLAFANTTVSTATQGSGSGQISVIRANTPNAGDTDMVLRTTTGGVVTERLRLNASGLTIADAHNLVFSTTTGTKIGTATTQKLSFYNSTPIVQPSGSVITALTNLGLVATPTIAESDVTSLVSDLALKAPLASPTFTGTLNAAAITSTGAITAGTLFKSTTTSGHVLGRSAALSDETLNITRSLGEGDPTLPGGTIALFQTNAAAGFSGSIGIISGTTGSSQVYFGNKNAPQAGYINWSNSSSLFTIQGAVTLNNTLTLAESANIVFGTTTGTKIGTSTSQKLGFFNATPIVQPTGDVVTALQNLGLVASATIAATTNANLTGPITSVGNATSIASQTGTGTKFVVDTSPTLVTPILGVATATSVNKMAITAPATSSTLAVANGKTFTASNTLTLAGTDSTTITFQGTDTYVGRTTTDTLTNKRVTPRVTSATSSATPTPDSDASDAYSLTALATDAVFAAPTGTPTNFQKLLIRIKDDGTARAITWNAIYLAMGVALPTTTVIGKILLVGFIYDSITSKWGCVAVNQEA